MTVLLNLDARMRSHYQSLVANFAIEAAAPVRAGAGVRPHRTRFARRLALAVVLASAATIVSVRLLSDGGTAPATLHLPGYTIVAAAGPSVTPRLTREEAIATALVLNQKANVSSPVAQRITGLRVIGATFAPHVLRVWSCRAHIYLQHVENIWIVEVTAPPQHGFQSIAGAWLVDDDTGNGAGGDLLLSGPLPTCPAP